MTASMISCPPPEQMAGHSYYNGLSELYCDDQVTTGFLAVKVDPLGCVDFKYGTGINDPVPCHADKVRTELDCKIDGFRTPVYEPDPDMPKFTKYRYTGCPFLNGS